MVDRGDGEKICNEEAMSSLDILHLYFSVELRIKSPTG